MCRGSLRRAYNTSLEPFSDEELTKKIEDLALKFQLSEEKKLIDVLRCCRYDAYGGDPTSVKVSFNSLCICYCSLIQITLFIYLFILSSTLKLVFPV